MPVSKTHERAGIVAYFLHPRRRVSTVYRALLPLPCFHCNRKIHPGELFSKQRPHPYRDIYSEHPFCRVCSPFEEKVVKASDEQLQPKLFGDE